MNLERKGQSTQRHNTSKRLNFETFVIWSFAVYSIAAFFYVMYEIWAKTD